MKENILPTEATTNKDAKKEFKEKRPLLADDLACSQPENSCKQDELRNLIAFFMIGFINNVGCAVMIAGAKVISNGGVGLVYFCGVFPSLFIKATGPYWFHMVSYRIRTEICVVLMATAFSTVAYGENNLGIQLFGVSCLGVQAGLGESSFLGLASFYDGTKALTFWGSGTGLSGVAGYLWVLCIHHYLRLSFKATLLLANIFPLILFLTFVYVLQSPWMNPARVKHDDKENQSIDVKNRDMPPTVAHKMSFGTRFRRIVMLYPYMLPLMLVYFSEYVMQSGTWAAMGFPMESKDARDDFYEYAGFCYQIGVFLSRSSGMFIQVGRIGLYIMPILQTLLLIFFTYDAAIHFWYNWWLLSMCLVAGLLGGAVYINAFMLIVVEVEPQYVEFSLSAASVADTLGIMCADICGLLLQGCLYSLNHIEGAKWNVSC